MKKFKGTQGELKITGRPFRKDSEYHSPFEVVNNENEIMAQVYAYSFFNTTLKRAEANAKLIAAAPLLLEALQSIENDNGSIPATIWKMRNDAISKALD